MTSPAEGPVVVDTGVFDARFSPRGTALEFSYRSLIAGRPVLISFVTRAELRFGASLGGGVLGDSLASTSSWRP